MKLEILKEMGFTDGELKVYAALVKLQKSTITKIIDYSGVSSSKVYLILDKLINKGIVNYIMINNIKEFSIANPSNLLEYIKQEKEKLNNVEEEAKKLVDDINKSLQKYQQESAHIYRGLLGVKTAHMNLLNELNKGEEYLFFSVDENMLEKKEVQALFNAIHLKRDERGITARGIAQPRLRKLFTGKLRSRKEYDIRFHELTLNQGITIGKNIVIIENTYPDAFAVEIVSSVTAKSYREFFNKLWKIAKR